jgi:hypothetical protein
LKEEEECYIFKMFVLTKAQGLQTAWKKKRRRRKIMLCERYLQIHIGRSLDVQ